MTPDTRTALDFAREILPQLGDGWRLDADTERAIAETDTFTRHWTGVDNPRYPGASLSINTSHRDGRLVLTADYPRDWQPYILGRGRVYRESITAAMTKSAAHIAADIQRRLLTATDYLTRVAECQARKAASEVAQEAGEALALELASVVGAPIEASRSAHLDNPDNRRKFTHWPRAIEDYMGLRIEVTVAHGGERVDIDLRGLSADDARALVQWWHRTTEAHAAAKGGQ